MAPASLGSRCTTCREIELGRCWQCCRTGRHEGVHLHETEQEPRCNYGRTCCMLSRLLHGSGHCRDKKSPHTSPKRQTQTMLDGTTARHNGAHHTDLTYTTTHAHTFTHTGSWNRAILHSPSHLRQDTYNTADPSRYTQTRPDNAQWGLRPGAWRGRGTQLSPKRSEVEHEVE